MSTFVEEPPAAADAPSTPRAAIVDPLPEEPTSILGVAFTEGATPSATGASTATSTGHTATSTGPTATGTISRDTVALVSDRTSTTVDTVDKPPKPNMGGLVSLSKSEWAAWTGGKPLSDWSGLDPTARVYHVSPNQLRPALASSAQKGYNYRRTKQLVNIFFIQICGYFSKFTATCWYICTGYRYSVFNSTVLVV